MHLVRAAVVAVCFSLVGTQALAAPKAAPPARSPLVSALERCRTISDPAQRLACFDSAAGSLVQAANTGQVTVVDRAQIQQAKRTLFGFNMPRISIFSGNAGDDTGDKLETTIKAVTQLNSGRFRMVLAEGDAVWETTEQPPTWFDDPRKGQKITILRGALGNYFLRINGQNGVRGRRIS